MIIGFESFVFPVVVAYVLGDKSMTRSVWRAYGFKSALLIFLCLPLYLPYSAAYPSDEQATRAQLAQLHSERQRLEASLKTIGKQRSSVQQQLQQSETTMGVIRQKMQQTEQTAKKAEVNLTALRQREQPLLALKQQQQQHIEQHILAAYQFGRQSKLKIRLNQQDPQSIRRLLTYYDYFNRARAEAMEDYSVTLAELRELEQAVASNFILLAQKKTQLAREQAELLVAIQDRAISLQRIDTTLQTRAQQREKLAQEQAELTALLQAIEEAVVHEAWLNQSSFTAARGTLPWPLVTPLIERHVLHRFGSRRQQGDWAAQGITIAAKEGTSVQAIHQGRVVFADWLRGLGLLIIIDHGGDYMSLYAHNQSLLQQVGDWVKVGDQIATVGNSGGQAQASLYVEIRHQGKPVNPQHWFKVL